MSPPLKQTTTVVAAAAATTAMLWIVGTLWKQSMGVDESCRIPDELCSSLYSKELELAVKLALQGEYGIVITCKKTIGSRIPFY
jgi:hypothetical protein